MSDNSCNTGAWGPIKTADTASPFQFTLSNDSAIMNNYVNESILVGGADINIFKMLGIHQQGKLTDLTGRGMPISSPSQPAYENQYAFDSTCGEWRSMARGKDVLSSAFIGYDFGEIKLANGRDQYGVNTYVQRNVASIKLQQGEHKQNRVTKCRVEYSEDGKTWRGAAVINVPDNGNLNTISFNKTVPSKFWRLRPLAFNGGVNDYWVVDKLQLTDFTSVSITNTQDDWGFLENRDREYATSSTHVKGTYEMVDVSSFLARFGMETSDEFTLKFNFMSLVASLGRPLLIGDIIEIPSQIQYAPDMTPVRKYMEITQVSWDTGGFTPGWVPTLVRAVAAPLIAKQEVMDIVGDFAIKKDKTGFVTNNPTIFSGLADILNERIDAASKDLVPEKGEDMSHKPIIPDAARIAAKALGTDIDQLNTPTTNTGYVEDAMPPGGEPYTEGDVLPENPKDGDYHRLTYLKTDKTLPARLYRYSVRKNRWIFLETDERAFNAFNSMKISKFLSSKNRANIDQVE